MEVSPPGGLLVRRAPGTAAFDFGQLIPLRTCWTAAGAGRVGHRSTLQHGVNGRQLTVGSPGGGPSAQQQQLVIHSESLAWACNLPDPAAALEYLQRAMLMAKVAGPGGMLVGQPGENFGAVLPCGFRWVLVGRYLLWVLGRRGGWTCCGWMDLFGVSQASGLGDRARCLRCTRYVY